MRIGTFLPLILIFAVFGGSLSSCRSKKEPKSEVQDAGKLYPIEFRKKLENLNPGLKDPAGVIQLIKMTGAEFIPELINNTEPAAVYLVDSALSAINLGIYTVDLVYLLTYEQKETADLVLERARELAENIGAGNLYDHAMYKRYRSAGVSSDTLIKFFSKASDKLENEYNTRGLLRLYTLYATGEFIEKLHLTTNMLIHADRTEIDQYWSLMMVLFQQQKALDELILLLDQIRYVEEGERFMAYLSDLKLIFMEITKSEELAEINTRNLTENQIFLDLVQQLAVIRNAVIRPE